MYRQFTMLSFARLQLDIKHNPPPTHFVKQQAHQPMITGRLQKSKLPTTTSTNTAGLLSHINSYCLIMSASLLAAATKSIGSAPITWYRTLREWSAKASSKGKGELFPGQAYRGVSCQVSIFARHLKFRHVQLASSNAAANLVSSSSFSAMSSSADLPPMMVLPTSSKQLSHN